jgi:hypothetical protein
MIVSNPCYLGGDLTQSISGKGKATTTLVPYDMQLLLSWFRWKTKHKSHLRPPVNGPPSGTTPVQAQPCRSDPRLRKLQYSSIAGVHSHMQVSAFAGLLAFLRLISLPRLYCDRLPLVLVLGASKSRALHDLLPRIVRTRLSVSVFNMPNGQQMFDSILREVIYLDIYIPTWLNYQFLLGFIFLG